MSKNGDPGTADALLSAIEEAGERIGDSAKQVEAVLREQALNARDAVDAHPYAAAAAVAVLLGAALAAWGLLRSR